jgi:hypothetical protein
MLYNYVLWFNDYEKLWYAVDRKTQIHFFSGEREKSIYYSHKSIDRLIQKIKS